ncbi:MAG: DUF89 family protein [Pirellulales bacterium]|nr:DUF89 family protein [Pirellulales bacterium]
MKTFFDCIPCLIRQSLDSVRRVSSDERMHEQIVRDTLRETSRMDLDLPPAVMAQKIHRRIRRLCNHEDPYREIKDRLNQLALELYPLCRQRVEQSEFPLEAAVRLAIAGNLMDLGVKSQLSETQVRAAVDECLEDPLDGDVAEFAAAVAEAGKILYLTDNAGEIVFDRLLIEQMPRERIIVAVKGAPVINDATLSDAETAGLPGIVRVIDNGSDAPGTVLDDCSETFRRHFTEADLIVAKGQGNYETLCDCPKTIYFLLRVKCPIIARDIGRPVDRMVVQPATAGTG